jgi:hypothetical protein
LTLAATAPLKAAVILDFNSGTCNIFGSGQASILAGAVCETTPIGTDQDNANWLKVSGSASAAIASGGSGAVVFQVLGTATGVQNTENLPLNWDFSVFDTNSLASQGSYSLIFNFSGGGMTYLAGYIGSLTYTPSGSGSFENVSGGTTVSLGPDITSYTVTLTINQASVPGETLTVTIPPGSIDINADGDPPSVPEPASFGLGASGLLGLLFARFRRKKA